MKPDKMHILENGSKQINRES